jgi:hypothetical protein
MPDAVELIARTLAMDQDTCDAVYGPGFDPLDIPEEWYTTPRGMAIQIVEGLPPGWSLEWAEPKE